MTTPAPATTAPDVADVLEAMFRAFGAVVPGAVQGAPDQWEADTLARLRHFGAQDADLDVLRAWLDSRKER